MEIKENMVSDIQNDCDNGKIIIRRIARPERRIVFSIGKRLFDLIMSILGMIVLAVPMLVLALIIKLDSKGPVFYKQERLGRNGKPFMLIKFRSMRTDAEANGAKWADNNDDRCTRIGAKLRKTRLDEIPQLWNIFCGHMSIVGPRPERSCFYKEFAKYIDGFEQRLYVTPGLTGYAQINGGYDLKPEEKIIYDLEYIEKMSWSFDFKIILGTVKVIFSHEGAR